MQARVHAHGGKHVRVKVHRRALGKDGVGLIDLGWYMIIKTVGRISARRKVKAKQPIAWARDDSSRVS